MTFPRIFLMDLIRIILILICSIPSAVFMVTSGLSCPSDWVLWTESCYRVFSDTRNWDHAGNAYDLDSCGTFPRGHIAVIQSREEMIFLSGKLTDKSWLGCIYEAMWKCPGQRSDMSILDTINVDSVIKWTDCLVLSPNMPNGTLGTADRNEELPYVCEFPANMMQTDYIDSTKETSTLLKSTTEDKTTTAGDQTSTDDSSTEGSTLLELTTDKDTTTEDSTKEASTLPKSTTEDKTTTAGDQTSTDVVTSASPKSEVMSKSVNKGAPRPTDTNIPVGLEALQENPLWDSLLQEWNTFMSLSTSGDNASMKNVQTDSYVLRVTNISSDIDKSTTEVNLEEVDSEVGCHVAFLSDALTDKKVDYVSVAVAKSLHENITLTPEDIEDEKTTAVYKFGSQILTINLFSSEGTPISYINGPPINMTFSIFKIEEEHNKHQDTLPLCKYFTNNKTWRGDGCDETFTNSTHVTCSCDHLTSFAVLMQIVDVGKLPEIHEKALNYLTNIGLSLSITCLILTLVLYGVCRVYKKTRIIIHINLAASLLVGQLIFITGIEANPEAACKSVGILLHYFFLVAFMWMLLEGVHLFLKVSPSVNVTMKIPVCLAIAWGLPILIVVISVAVRHNLYGLNNSCFLPLEEGVIYAFVGPALLIVVVNAIILIATLSIFLSLKANQDKSERDRIKATLRAMFILTPILGLTWIFGLLQLIPTSAIVFSYLFTICNATQGIFIFITQCLMDEDVKKFVKQKRGRVDHSDAT